MGQVHYPEIDARLPVSDEAKAHARKVVNPRFIMWLVTLSFWAFMLVLVGMLALYGLRKSLEMGLIEANQLSAISPYLNQYATSENIKYAFWGAGGASVLSYVLFAITSMRNAKQWQSQRNLISSIGAGIWPFIPILGLYKGPRALAQIWSNTARNFKPGDRGKFPYLLFLLGYLPLLGLFGAYVILAADKYLPFQGIEMPAALSAYVPVIKEWLVPATTGGLLAAAWSIHRLLSYISRAQRFLARMGSPDGGWIDDAGSVQADDVPEVLATPAPEKSEPDKKPKKKKSKKDKKKDKEERAEDDDDVIEENHEDLSDEDDLPDDVKEAMDEADGLNDDFDDTPPRTPFPPKKRRRRRR